MTIPVGVAQVDITPDFPVRLSGFGGRRTESEGVTQRIWAKALAVGDDQQGPAVLITTDNLGVSDEITQLVAERLAQRAGLKRERLAITATHTHTAPMLKNVVPTLFGVPIPPEHQANIDRYTSEFINHLERVALAAIADLRPSRLSWGLGTVGFAVNRRTAGGPVDHDLPLLVVRDMEGKIRALYFSYACHCVTLSLNKISGDWAGYAMDQIQSAHPGVIALASVGCGADSNPSSGVTGDKVEVVDDQGRQVAREVDRLLRGPLTPIEARPVTHWTRIDLPLAPPRSRAQWEQRASAQDAVGYHARVNLARLDRGEALPTQINYPVQTWVFGDALAMVFLPGEVVVDYALRLKREFDQRRIWVNAYANDAPCYIPSERVLQEGGYEGGDAMIYYDQPQIFAPGLEQKIIAAVREQVPPSFRAAEGTEGTRPLRPDQAVGSLRVKPGLIVELVASEPLIVSPVAIDWDSAGRMFVCEMFDYPTGLDENWLPGGRIKRLVDTDGDGVYDQGTVFLDGLPFPTGVTAWGRGLLVCAAPDILYAEDTDGDGRADRVEKWFSGFAAENYQARVNSLSLGLDNWIYGANGLLGGVIHGRGETLDIRGHDFRFRFEGGAMETVNGLTQQGRVRDDWGRWFGCNNGSALDYYPHEARYLRRNPHVTAPPASLSPLGDFDLGRVYPISRLQERFNDPDAANRITSGCGLGIYRDTVLGQEYYGNTFTCEPVHNLVHRLILEEKEFELRRRRAPDETQSEFLASTDNWFRPVQVRTGPDGGLYVVDMYRFLIEHPRWIPAARLSRIDVRAGASMGRVYRLRSAQSALHPVADLTRLNGKALAEALQSPNGTERDRVQVELLHRRDPATVKPLRDLARTALLPQVRVQALSAVDGLGALDAATLIASLEDPDERVRSQAVRHCETILVEKTQGADQRDQAARTISRMLSLTNDSSALVARQLAFTLGEWNNPKASHALAHLARAWIGQPEVRTAVLSSAGRHGAEILTAMIRLDEATPGLGDWLDPLVATAAASEDESVLRRAWLALLPEGITSPTAGQLAGLGHLLNAMDKRKLSIEDYFQTDPELRSLQTRLVAILGAASEMANRGSSPIDVRLAAIRVMGRASTSESEIEQLSRLLSGTEAPELRAAARDGLRRQRSTSVPEHLLSAWPRISPAGRQEIVQLLLGREAWTLRLLEAVQAGFVQSREISLADRQRLSQSAAASIRKLAMEVVPLQAVSGRAEVIGQYQGVLALSGNPQAGAEVFAKTCATCHAWKGVGHAVGPDLAGLRGKEPEYWMKNILDPNAVVEPRFIAYEIETTDDRSLSGIIQTETVTSLTLISGNGVTEVLPRSVIKDIRASNLSLMPEGLEQSVAPQAMADLLAYLVPRRTPKSFPGNRPETVTTDANGIALLAAAQAEIYGGNIAFESLFQNIGMWHGVDDYAAWTLEVSQAGSYDIFIDYACAAASAGNGYRLDIGGQSLTGQVAATGSDWSRYVQTKIGTVPLTGGRQRLTFRPENGLRAALLDLRAVALAPPGKTPPWPKPMQPTPADGLLRDPVSIARFLMDGSQPEDAREAVIRANPQYAADFIQEMTKDLVANPGLEYERIPWIWRVAIACGKRNETTQIRRVLEVSLPKPEETLRDWQAVVLGGGIINGLSQRGIWPEERLAAILAETGPLSERWRRAMDLAVIMTDSSQVPNGTRYDALRMLAMDPWEKHGPQILRYLGREVDAELQMGAVSALGDLPSPLATQALVGALDHLQGVNRDLALNALLRDDARVEALLDYATARSWKAEALGADRVSQLVEHSTPILRERAHKLFGSGNQN